MNDTQDEPPHGSHETDNWILDHVVDLDADGRDGFVARLRETDEALADRAAVYAHRMNVFDVLDAEALGSALPAPTTPSRLAALEESLDADSPAVKIARLLAGPASEIAGDLVSPLEPGDAVGAYRIVRELGRGGTGVVFLAERDDIGLLVALKLLSNPFAHSRPDDRDGDPAGDLSGYRSERLSEIARFLSEQRALARLRHPGIVQVYDAGVAPDGRSYVAMELVEGVPLTEYAQGLGVTGRIRLFRLLCEAIGHVHARGFAHGDVKPANAVVREDDTGRSVVKVVDFGVATPIRGADGLLAAPPPSSLTGGAAAYLSIPEPTPLTPAYASLERMAGAPPSVASDVYALGVVLGEVFSVRGDSGDERCGLSGTARATLSPIADVARRASADDPRDRYPSVEALMRDLQDAAHGAVLASLPVANAGASSLPPPRGGLSRDGREPVRGRASKRPPASRAWVWPVAALTAFGAAFIAWR